MTWYPEAISNIPMNDMNLRADPFRDYPGRTYRFYTGIWTRSKLHQLYLQVLIRTKQNKFIGISQV